MAQPLWKVWKFLQKLEMQLPHEPRTALLGIFSQVTDGTGSHKNLRVNLCASGVHHARTGTAQTALPGAKG